MIQRLALAVCVLCLLPIANASAASDRMQVSVVVQPSCVAQSSGGAVRVVCTQNVPAQNETVARERAAAPPRVDTQIVAGRTVVTVMF